MRKLSFYWFFSTLTIVMVVSACSSNQVTPESTVTQTPNAVSADTANAPTPEESKIVADPNILYHDDFTNPASGWREEKFDNFFIGYHEPEYYHVEVSSPNYKTTVFEPGKGEYGDVTIEVKAFTASGKTSETGDFDFGPAFRRSGDQYYAFTISQRNKEWYVLKSTPNALVVLAEGINESIHNLDEGDVLRVDALGSNFSFYINDELVSQVTDSDYATGEIGFFVQTFDATNAHIHFDDLTVNKLELKIICKVNSQKLNVRNGPGTSYASSSSLSLGEMVEPIGRNEDGTWLQINIAGSNDPSWISNSRQSLSCNDTVDSLAVTSP